MTTGKQVRLVRTDNLDIQVADDGIKHLHGHFADPSAPFVLTINGVDMPIDLTVLCRLHGSIETYLHDIGYDAFSLEPIKRYIVQSSYRIDNK